MAGKIFINYRREDAGADARSIRDRLVDAFGKKNVFMDVDDVEPGERFDRKLDEALSECSVFLAVIGPQWLDWLRKRAESGSHDYVRQEIATALERDIFVVPVPVRRAQWPPSGDMPGEIANLVLHQKHDVTHERFGRDMAELVGVVKSRLPRRRRNWVAASAGTIVAVALLVLGAERIGLLRPHFVLRPTDDSALVAGQTFRDCDDCPEMVVLPAGQFTMGSPETEPGRAAAEGPQHRVKIGRRLAIGKFEVTVAEYEAFVKATGGVSDGGGCNVWTAYGHRFEKDRSYASPSFSQGPRNPVVCLTWQAATTFANWLTAVTRKKYRLLSEAEWEYAARAGSTTRYFFGDDESKLCEHGNGADRTSAFLWGNHLCSDGVGVQTVEVGKYQPNAFGLNDTIGNVSEWVQDCAHPNYDGAPTDGSAWMSGDCSHRVIRGGSWDNGAGALRSATRGAGNMQGRDNVGFRVAREME